MYLINKLIKIISEGGRDIDSSIYDFIANTNEKYPNLDVNKLKFKNEVEYDYEYIQSYTNSDATECYYLRVDKRSYETQLFQIDEKHFDDNDLILWKNSQESITYRLIPFEQGEEVPVSALGYTDIKEIQKNGRGKITFDNFEGEFSYDLSFQWIDNMVLYIGDCDSITYIVAKDNTVLSAFYDEEYYFQQGDYDTYGYIENWTNNLIIENRGDVSSVVIIKYNQ